MCQCSILPVLCAPSLVTLARPEPWQQLSVPLLWATSSCLLALMSSADIGITLGPNSPQCLTSLAFPMAAIKNGSQAGSADSHPAPHPKQQASYGMNVAEMPPYPPRGGVCITAWHVNRHHQTEGWLWGNTELSQKQQPGGENKMSVIVLWKAFMEKVVRRSYLKSHSNYIVYWICTE